MVASQNKIGVYCLANDNVIEWFEAFIRSYRLDNATLPLTVIPFDGAISRLKALQARFRFDILDEAECRRFDLLASQVMDSDRLAGAYRKFACFFGPYDEFLFLDSDIVVTTSLGRLLDAFSKSDYDFVYFDYDMDMAYKPSLAARMMVEYGSHGFNSGAFLSRKGIIREVELPSLAGKASAVREGLAGTLEQPFLNFVMDASRLRMTGMNTLLPELAPKVWARQPFQYDSRSRMARTPDGKILPFIHWPGCGFPMMVRKEIFLEYRTLGMTLGERLNYKRKFYYRRFRGQLKQILLRHRLTAGLVELRKKLK